MLTNFAGQFPCLSGYGLRLVLGPGGGGKRINRGDAER